MEEGASPAMTTAAPIEVEFNISGLVLAGDDANPAALGVLTDPAQRPQTSPPRDRGCSHGRQPSDLDRFQ